MKVAQANFTHHSYFSISQHVFIPSLIIILSFNYVKIIEWNIWAELNFCIPYWFVYQRSAQFLDVLFVFDLYIVNYQFCFVLIHYSLVNDNWFVGDRVEFILRLWLEVCVDNEGKVFLWEFSKFFILKRKQTFFRPLIEYTLFTILLSNCGMILIFLTNPLCDLFLLLKSNQVYYCWCCCCCCCWAGSGASWNSSTHHEITATISTLK